jgi:hypothetical protein
MKRFSLWVYVIAVIVTLAIVNWLAWRTGGAVEFGKVEHFSIGPEVVN